MFCERNNRTRILHILCTYACKNTVQIQFVTDSRIYIGKSSLITFDRHGISKYKHEDRHFRHRGYFVDSVGKGKKMDTYTDPFMGER